MAWHDVIILLMIFGLATVVLAIAIGNWTLRRDIRNLRNLYGAMIDELVGRCPLGADCPNRHHHGHPGHSEINSTH